MDNYIILNLNKKLAISCIYEIHFHLKPKLSMNCLITGGRMADVLSGGLQPMFQIHGLTKGTNEGPRIGSPTCQTLNRLGILSGWFWPSMNIVSNKMSQRHVKGPTAPCSAPNCSKAGLCAGSYPQCT